MDIDKKGTGEGRQNPHINQTITLKDLGEDLKKRYETLREELKKTQEEIMNLSKRLKSH